MSPPTFEAGDIHMADGKMRVGFLGVGLMGHGMAKNIMERGGHPLTVVGHRNRAPVEDLVARGAKEAKDIAALAAASDVVFTCLPSSVEMEAAYLGPGGLLAAAAAVARRARPRRRRRRTRRPTQRAPLHAAHRNSGSRTGPS